MKSNKKIANLILTTAAVLATVGTVSQVDPAVDPNHEIFCPGKVEAGSLVLMNVQGNDVRWDIFPEVPVETYGEHNSQLATAFQDVGDYLVVAAFTDTDGRVRLEKQLVSALDELSPTPAPPEPRIETTIEEEVEASVLEDVDIPVFEPVPDSHPNTKYPDVKQKIVDVCVRSKLSVDKARTLSGNFLTVAENIRLGKYGEPKEVLRETSNLNRPHIKTGVFTTKLQVIVSTMRFDGEVVTLDDYQDLWTQIGEGLSEYAETR